MVRDKPGGDGAGQTEDISWQQDWATRTWEVDGSRKPHQREEKLALHCLGTELVLVIHRKQTLPPPSPALSGPHISPHTPVEGAATDQGPCFPGGQQGQVGVSHRTCPAPTTSADGWNRLSRVGSEYSCRDQSADSSRWPSEGSDPDSQS